MANQENQIQAQIVSFLRMNNIICFSVPNGSYLPNTATRMIFKRTGLLSGVADLVLLLPGGETIFIEVKTPKGRLSATQQEFRKEVTELGFTYLVMRDLQDAVDFVKGLKELKK